MDTPAEHRHIAALQMHWRANALKDAKYNLHRAEVERKMGNRVLADGYMKEYRVCLYWAERRKKIAESEMRKAQ